MSKGVVYAYKGRLINFSRLSKMLQKKYGLTVSQSYLSKIFSGSRTVPWEVAVALSNHFGITLDEFGKLLEDSKETYKRWKEGDVYW